MKYKNRPAEKESKTRIVSASFDGRDFSNMDLENADFSFSSMRETNFDGANLKGARIRFSTLQKTTFRNADLRNADLSFSTLSDVDLEGAKVEGANFSFTTQDTSYNWKSFSLIGLIQSQGWLGTLVAVFLGAIMLYGINAILFFTAEIYFTTDLIRGKLYQYLVLQNVITGVTAVLTAKFLASWLDSIPKEIVRYLLLSVVMFIVISLISSGVYFAFGVTVVHRFAELYPEEASRNAPGYWYMIGPIIVANVFYFISNQGKQISRKISDQEYQLLNLEKLKTRAELDALQARINPHFLYNALNSIASLVHDNPEKAEEMTLLLSKLFRYTTGRKTDDYYDTISNELEMVQTYLLVEKVRFGDRLKFTVEVSDPVLNSLYVPKFILQPIVENAIKHGVSKLADLGAIKVKIFEKTDWLVLCVQDNGPAFSEEMETGYGIRSIQEKLKLLYGQDGKIELLNEPDKSVTISIRKRAMIKQQ
ncbi:MAG TPA: histidine kinase [Dyadobacter sp.]|nr:histidine kinase [Dyadobacter sp.]